MGKLLRLHSVEFDVSLELDNAIDGDNIDTAVNSIFLYNMCSLFKIENLNLQFNKTVTKISDGVGIKTAFLATLK